ncbi:MAG: DUF6049 family protein [Actinomycetota bacterium]|nr:DUF6049 family protein [Actinomycetota bacterium]
MALVVVPPPAAVATTPPTLTLLSQSAWVHPGDAYRLHLRVGNPAIDKLQVTVYSRLTARAYFDQSLAGKMRGGSIYRTAPLLIAKLTADPAGGVDVDLPVNAPATTTGIPTFGARSDTSGVYPVQVTSFDANGIAVGSVLTTYLVFSAASSEVTKLSVALTVPFHSAPTLGADKHPARLDVADSDRLAALTAALSRTPSVPLSFDVTPQTVESLASGTPAQRATVATLANVVDTPHNQLLAEPYVHIPLGVLDAAGLDDEVTAQLSAGRSVLDAALHQAPQPTTWVTNEALDAVTLNALTARGTTRLVVPDHTLTALSTNLRQSTFGRPAMLTAKSGAQVTAFGADDGLVGDFVTGGDQVLAANHLLAELAMIQLEQPSETRGVAILPPAGWSPDPTFLATVLSGLGGNPLLSPVSVDSLFSAVPPSTASHPPVNRGLVPTKVPTVDAAAVNGWRNARQQLTGFRAIVPSTGRLGDSLAQQLLVSESTDLDGVQRQAVLATVTGTIRQVERRISLPGPASITLTARNGNVPLTVLSDPSLVAQVQLRLISQKLIFRPFRAPGARCDVPAPTVLACQLSLTSQSTTLKVPVETRTSGVFSLAVSVLSPDGSVTLATARNTVRSTVFSGVGVILIVVAGLSLALWWFGNARHGRRAHELIPVPDPEMQPLAAPAALGAPVGAPAQPGVAPGTATPEIVAEFFASPPPAYPSGLESGVSSPGTGDVSPSVGRHSPN